MQKKLVPNQFPILIEHRNGICFETKFGILVIPQFSKNDIEGDWKLHVRKGDEEMRALYNLKDDPGETENLYQEEPDVVKRLEEILECGRKDLGDDATG